MYIRYTQVKLSIDSGEIDLREGWNTASMYCGIIACLGLSVVANFQETSVFAVHILGALAAFGIGATYFLLQVSVIVVPASYRNKENRVQLKKMYMSK